MKVRFQWLYAIMLVLYASSFVQAQVVMTSEEIERGLRFPWSGPYGGEPFTQRYSYSTNSGGIYLGGNPRSLYYLDYLDRADRAQKFGYPMPVDPYFETYPDAQADPSPPVRGHVFGGFGIFRRR